MMRYSELVVILSLATLMASCRRQEQTDQKEPFVFRASIEQPATKAVLDETGTHILWQPGDRINIFGGTGIGAFNARCQEIVPSVEFSGYFSVDPEGSCTYWASYPYNEANTFDQESITLTVPSEQKLTEESFDRYAFVMMAQSEQTDLLFRNLCGGIAFTLSGFQNNRVTSIEFRGNNGECIAGTVRAVFNENGVPVVREIVDGKTTIELKPSNYGRLMTGVWYYIAALPQVLSKGYSVTLYHSNGSFEKTYPNAVAIKRSTWGMIHEADLNVELVPFVDQQFYYYCRQYRDSDGDNLISIEEALSQTDISCSSWGIQTLVDLQYFPNIVNLNCVNNSLTELDVRLNTRLRTIDCQNNKISDLKIDGLKDLSYLTCTNNKLTFLDLSAFPNLVSLRCKGNPDLREVWLSPSQTFRKLEYDSNVTTIRYVGVKSVTLNKTELVMAVGQRFRLTAKVDADRDDFKKVSWYSSDDSIASINQDGVITAKRVGQATITAMASDKSATCDITIVEPNPDGNQGDISFDDWEEGVIIVF